VTDLLELNKGTLGALKSMCNINNNILHDAVVLCCKSVIKRS